MIPVLDHGYVQSIEHWGSDERIIESARMSTGKGFLGWGEPQECDLCDGDGEVSCGDVLDNDIQKCPKCAGKGHRTVVPGDEKLLRYLYENKHATPFEFAGLVIEVQAPIFVFREWHRHRTQSYNEMSARYTPMPDLNYIPTVERLMLNGGSNKQAQGTGEALTYAGASYFRSRLKYEYDSAEACYQNALSAGIPKELARLCIPVGRYSRMRASANLRNWLAFLTLRQAPQAQWEIRQFANAVGEIIAERFPRTWELFSEGQ